MTLTTSLKVICEALYAAPAVAGSQFATADANLNRSQFATLTSGVGLNQCDKAFSETRTIAASGSHNYALNALTDIFAGALAFIRVKALLLFADSGNTNNVVIGAGGANSFHGPLGSDTDTLTIAPGGLVCILAPTAAGWVVGTDIDLLISNSGAGTGVTYDLLLLGASA